MALFIEACKDPNWSCPQCTYINTRNSHNCAICNASNIKHEPTNVFCEQCKMIIDINDYESHLAAHEIDNNNTEPSIPCDYPQCNQIIPFKEYDAHRAKHTEIKLIPCEYPSCNLKLRDSEYTDHLLLHQYSTQRQEHTKLIQCDYPNCGQKVAFSAYKAHQESHKESEQNTSIECDYPACNQMVLFSEYDAHIQNHKQDDEKKTDAIMISCDYAGCNDIISFKLYSTHQLKHKTDDEQKLREQNLELQHQLTSAQVDLEKQKLEIERAKLKLEEERLQLEKKNENEAKETEELRRKIQEHQEKVKKLEAKAHSNEIEYPKWWKHDQLRNNTNYGAPKLVEMDLVNNATAKEVAQRFYTTTANAQQIIKIESLENQMLFDRYWNAKQTLLKLIGTQKVNEKWLFHGTKREDVMSFVQKEGFRKEFNVSAASGKGTYLARDASYSVGYSTTNGNIRKMFHCLVICGESHQGNGGYQLTSWPKKPSGLIYDSLVNTMANPSVFVIHEDVRIYPMFIIHFKNK